MSIYDLSKPSGAARGYSSGDAAVHEVCPRTSFRFGSSTTLTTIKAAQRLDATDWVGGILVVRLHAVVTWPRPPRSRSSP